MALYEQYLREGGGFVPKYLGFLGSGGKAEPKELLRPFGVDLADPRFWNGGVKIVENLVTEAEGISGQGPVRPGDSTHR